MKILLACDQKWRDLPSLVAIKYYLEKLGHTTYIYSTKEMESMIGLVQPDCVVLNNFWDARYIRLAKRLRDCGITVAVLPTEGATPLDKKGPLVLGAYSDFSLIDLHFCWNQKTADGMVEFGSISEERLAVVGCPRFDFAVPPLVGACMTRAELCTTLGLDPRLPIVTFASRYALARLAYSDEETKRAAFTKFREIGYAQSIEQSGYTLDDLFNSFKTMLDVFIDTFCVAVSEMTDVQFLFKPHPNDDVDYIRRRIGGAISGRTKIAVDVYIGDVLRASDVLVNADCNTSVEAWIHGVPVVDVQIIPDRISGRPDISAGNWVASDQKEVLEYIRRGLIREPVQQSLIEAQKLFIATWFHTVDGRRCRTIAGTLDIFLRDRGRKKHYPLAASGGLKHVLRTALAWRLGLPGGVPVKQALRDRPKTRAGIYDKSISRADVVRLQRKIRPILAVASDG